MQIKLFTVPVFGGEEDSAALNTFLRGHKILSVEHVFVPSHTAPVWAFSIRFLENAPAEKPFPASKIDYRTLLSTAAFARFSLFRAVRKRLAEAETVPAYAIFTDAELSKMAQAERLDAASMRAIAGIGERKMEKYAAHFLVALAENPPADSAEKA